MARSNWDITELAEAYRARCGTLGQRVRAELPGGGELIGIATDVDAEGRVVIDIDGQLGTIAVAAGDITHLRPGCAPSSATLWYMSTSIPESSVTAARRTLTGVTVLLGLLTWAWVSRCSYGRTPRFPWWRW